MREIKGQERIVKEWGGGETEAEKGAGRWTHEEERNNNKKISVTKRPIKSGI